MSQNGKKMIMKIITQPHPMPPLRPSSKSPPVRILSPSSASMPFQKPIETKCEIIPVFDSGQSVRGNP